MRDLRNTLSSAQAVTSSDVSDNSLDLGAVDKELGLNKLILHVLVTTAFTGFDSGVIIHLIDGTGVNGSGEINAGKRELLSTGVLAQALFTTAGGHFQIPVPARKLQRYLACEYEAVTEVGVTGDFTAWIDESTESDVV